MILLEVLPGEVDGLVQSAMRATPLVAGLLEVDLDATLELAVVALAESEQRASLTDAERRALGYGSLPASLDHALEYREESEFVAETLGEQVFNYVLLNKRREWQEYRAQVTPFELQKNLEML